MILHEIRRPNSLKIVPSGVANCRNLPFGGRATGGSRVHLTREENAGVATNVYLRKTSEKPERCGLRTLSVKGSGVVFTHGKGISTPCVHHKGQQPLIKCANMTSKCYIFLFLCLFVFLCFLILVWSTRVFPSLLHILNCDEEIIPM